MRRDDEHVGETKELEEMSEWIGREIYTSIDIYTLNKDTFWYSAQCF